MSHYSTHNLLAASWTLRTSQYTTHAFREHSSFAADEVVFHLFISGVFETKLSPFALSCIRFNFSREMRATPKFYANMIHWSLSYRNMWNRFSLAIATRNALYVVESNNSIQDSRISSNMSSRCLCLCFWAISQVAIIVIKAVSLCLCLSVVNSFHSLIYGLVEAHTSKEMFHWSLLRLVSLSFSARWVSFIFI